MRTSKKMRNIFTIVFLTVFMRVSYTPVRAEFVSDLNNDDIVDIQDLAQFFTEWLTCTLPNIPGCGRINKPPLKPNIIFVMADDLGWTEISSPLTTMGHQSDFYETPTLERIAEEGIAFTNAYTCGVNCAPTRTSLYSGQYPQRHTNNVYLVNSLNRGGSNTLLVGPSQGVPVGGGYQDELPAETFTIAEMLKTAGYKSAHFAKYHVGGSLGAGDPYGPNGALDQGFDANYGGTTAGGPGKYHAYLSNDDWRWSSAIANMLDYALPYTSEQSLLLTESDTLLDKAKNIIDATADSAIDFMEANKEHPFYLDYCEYAIHSPTGASHARPDLLAKYNQKLLDGNYPGPSGHDDPAYAALIENADQSFGRLIEYLETTDDPRNPGQKLAENTIVFFYSDNGGDERVSKNTPLKGKKGELDEGGIRVPLIAWSRNPNLVKGSVVNHTPIQTIDFYATFADLAGVNTSALTLDGESLTDLLAGQTDSLTRDAIYWHFPGYLVDTRNQRPQSAIRSGKWKLMYNYEDQTFELYNLDNDISEANNVAAANPEVVNTLGLKLMYWLKEMDSPLAALRSGKSPITLTVNGFVYVNGAIVEYTNHPITVNTGQEAPYILPR